MQNREPLPEPGTFDLLTRMDEILRAMLKHIRREVSPDDMKALLTGAQVPYGVKAFKLDTARDKEPFDVDGDHILAATDGTLTGCSLILNKNDNDSIPLDRFNPVAALFGKLFLTTTAQAGKTLYLFIGREAATEATTSTSVVTTAQDFNILSTLKGTHFTGAIAQNAKEDENLTGLLAGSIRITGISFQAKQQLHFKLLFWHKDTFDNTDLDVDEFCGEVDIDLATYGIQIGGANQWYLDIRNLHLDYIDFDGSKELHVSLMNMSVAGKTAGAAGEVRARITYETRT